MTDLTIHQRQAVLVCLALMLLAGACAQATPTPAPPTPSPTLAPSPTASPIPTAAATATPTRPAPTAVPPTSTPVAPPATAVPTQTPSALRYPAPQLLAPDEAAPFTANASVEFKWSSVATLAANEYYHVDIQCSRADGTIHYWGLESTEPSYLLLERASEVIRPPATGNDSWPCRWRVGTLAKPDGKVVGPYSDYRTIRMEPKSP